MIETLKTRKRVVDALLSREAKKRFGDNYLGLMSAFLEPFAQVFFFGMMFYVTDRQGPHGANVLVFMVTGVLPFHLFSKTMTRGMGAIDANKTLLSYPIMKPIDTVVARMMLEGLIYIMTFILIMLTAFYFELIDGLARFPYVFWGIVLALFMGFSFGVLAAASMSLCEATKRIVPIINRAIFLTSGVFFSVSMIPQFGREILFWNPMLHISEMTRHGTFQNFPDSYFNVEYILVVITVTLTFGLVLLNHAENSPKARIRGA